MHTVKTRRTLTVEEAENLAGSALAAAARSEAVTIDLSRTRNYQIGAAARIGNCLRRVALSSKITVELPDDRLHLSQLQGTGIGPQIANLATTLRHSGKSRTRQLRSQLSSTYDAPATTLVLHDLKTHPSLVSREQVKIERLLTDWLSEFPAQSSRTPSGSELKAVSAVVHESIANVRDHSDKRPLVGDLSVHSYAVFRWRSGQELELAPEGFDGEDPSSRYLLSASTTSPYGTAGGFLEITIADDGTGIAPRQALDAGIDSAPDRLPERSALSEALAAGGTVKLRAKDCPIEMTPGYGSEVISQKLVDLGAFLSIRTGRFVAYLDGLEQRADELQNGLSSEPGTSINERNRRPISGTILSILIPSFESPLPRRHIRPDPATLF